MFIYGIGLLTAVFLLRSCEVVFGFRISVVGSLVIGTVFILHHMGDLFGWRLQEFVDLRLSLMLN
jgi:hypothetical protein